MELSIKKEALYIALFLAKYYHDLNREQAINLFFSKESMDNVPDVVSACEERLKVLQWQYDEIVFFMKQFPEIYLDYYNRSRVLDTDTLPDVRDIEVTRYDAAGIELNVKVNDVAVFTLSIDLKTEDLDKLFCISRPEEDEAKHYLDFFRPIDVAYPKVHAVCQALEPLQSRLIKEGMPEFKAFEVLTDERIDEVSKGFIGNYRPLYIQSEFRHSIFLKHYRKALKEKPDLLDKKRCGCLKNRAMVEIIPSQLLVSLVMHSKANSDEDFNRYVREDTLSLLADIDTEHTACFRFTPEGLVEHSILVSRMSINGCGVGSHHVFKLDLI